MKLWIRSQDKTRLEEVEEIKIEDIIDSNPNNANGYKEPRVIGYKIICNGKPFAKYDTNKRALELLNEIQSLLVGSVIVEPKASKTKKDDAILEAQPINIKPLNQNCVVYELPIK